MNEIKKERSFLNLLLIGLIIGIASITPGLSGGILAISFGIYEMAVNSVINLRNNFKKNFNFLFPLGIGAVIGIVIFGFIMKPLFSNFEKSVIYLFLGMIVGSLPSFLKEANKNGFRILYIIPFLIAFTLGIFFSTTFIKNSSQSELNVLKLVIGGCILSLGMVVPGISSSLILIDMGIYESILDSFLSINIYVIFWVAIGFLISSLLSLKLINMAFKKFSGFTHYAAFGFLVSSIIAVFPGFEFNFVQIINLILFIIGAVSVYIFMKKTNKNDA